MRPSPPFLADSNLPLSVVQIRISAFDPAWYLDPPVPAVTTDATVSAGHMSASGHDRIFAVQSRCGLFVREHAVRRAHHSPDRSERRSKANMLRLFLLISVTATQHKREADPPLCRSASPADRRWWDHILWRENCAALRPQTVTAKRERKDLSLGLGVRGLGFG